MKIQQNYNQPSFGLKLNINSHAAYVHNKEMISKAEKLLLNELAEPIGTAKDSLSLNLGSVVINRVADKNNFRQTYTLTGNAIINEAEKKVNLTQTWLHSEGDFNSHKPFDVIKKYLESLVKSPIGRKK